MLRRLMEWCVPDRALRFRRPPTWWSRMKESMLTRMEAESAMLQQDTIKVALYSNSIDSPPAVWPTVADAMAHGGKATIVWEDGTTLKVEL